MTSPVPWGRFFRSTTTESQGSETEDKKWKDQAARDRKRLPVLTGAGCRPSTKEGRMETGGGGKTVGASEEKGAAGFLRIN